MTEIRIHPFDIYDKLTSFSTPDILAMVDSPTSLVIDGVRYIEDTSLPFDRELAEKNGLLGQL